MSDKSNGHISKCHMWCFMCHAISSREITLLLADKSDLRVPLKENVVANTCATLVISYMSLQVF